MVVHNRVRQENFVEPAPAEIQRGRVIEGARSAYSRKPHVIGTIPETVSRPRRACLWNGSCNLGCCLGLVSALDFCGRRLLRSGFSRAEWKQKRDEHRASPPKSHPKAFPPPNNFPSVPLWGEQIVCKPSRVVKSGGYVCRKRFLWRSRRSTPARFARWFSMQLCHTQHDHTVLYISD